MEEISFQEKSQGFLEFLITWILIRYLSPYEKHQFTTQDNVAKIWTSVNYA